MLKTSCPPGIDWPRCRPKHPPISLALEAAAELPHVQELREIAKAPADLGIKLEPVGATLSSWKAVIKVGLLEGCCVAVAPAAPLLSHPQV